MIQLMMVVSQPFQWEIQILIDIEKKATTGMKGKFPMATKFLQTQTTTTNFFLTFLSFTTI